MTDDNGATPEVTPKYQVLLIIDHLDRLQIVAQELPLDRVDVIVSRAHDWTRREMDAGRTAEVIEARQKKVRLAEGPLPPMDRLRG